MPPVVNRNYWIDNLRSFITVLVVAHHASLAYTTFAYFDKSTYINSTHSVVDDSRWIGMDVFVNFNDIFFMPLMFMISGLFFFNGLKKKGKVKLLLDRTKRLGLPFIIAEVCVIPIAYIPSYFLVNHQFRLSSFISDYLGRQHWPVGPPWFIWLLLAFNILASLLPKAFYTNASGFFLNLSQKPFQFFITCFVISAVALIPLSLRIGQYTWTGFGPFDFQLNRVIFYFVFFLLGAILGTVQWEAQLFTGNLFLGKSTFFWIILSVLFFGIIELVTFWGYAQFAAWHVPGKAAITIFLIFFVASSILSCFAFITLFKDFLNKTSVAWKSLSANAYGIYLVHYAFLTWMQFALLNIDLPVVVKFVTVFVVSLTASWYFTYLLKKIKIVSSLI